MTRRGPTLALVLFCLAAPVHAQGNPVEEGLVASLRAQGYDVLEHGYTWLGRLRIVAQNDTLRRELVVNPGTGEVLRDYAERLDLPKPGGTPSQSVASAGGTTTTRTTDGGTVPGVAASSVATVPGLTVSGAASGTVGTLVLEPAVESQP
ncbi:hypothetical protein [Stagnihabitans tardus]|uniref:PepSY domain-containing protein n=1 Tax=Stagnihabitans tardus TaxID=2699202 RepID=A0AAE4YDW2_9RHOB|nr:hypothetical protein [Stagnihabitans tardus]NBZ88469.1 hypothetical protein [Stagnihabitans tardus]